MKNTIASASNTLVPAFLVLKAKGFRVYQSKIGDEGIWVAETSENKFIAENTVTLLGLQAMYENRQANWKATDSEINAFFKEFPEFR